MSEYLKIPEVAQRLDVSEKTARRYVKTGELPSVFLGGAYRVSEEDLENYLEAAKVEPGDGSGKAQAPPPLEERGDIDQQLIRELEALEKDVEDDAEIARRVGLVVDLVKQRVERAKQRNRERVTSE